MLGKTHLLVAARGIDSQLLYWIAGFGFTTNLFNMLPFGMMDGGYIAEAVGKVQIGCIVLGMGGAMAYTFSFVNPLLYLIMAGGGYQIYRWSLEPALMTPKFYKIDWLKRAVLASLYFGLIGALTMACAFTFSELKRKLNEECLVFGGLLAVLWATLKSIPLSKI
jgi:hypothetical protein